MGVSKELTPIFLLVLEAKVLPGESLLRKNGRALTDEELVANLIELLKDITDDRLDLARQVARLEKHILDKYGEIFDPYSD